MRKRALVSSLTYVFFGFALAWPSAHQWSVLLPAQRLNAASLVFVVSFALALVFAKLQRKTESRQDVAHALCLMLGAALCFSFVRQEITLLVYSALWAFPGTFLGTASAEILFMRPDVSPPSEVSKQKAEPFFSREIL